MIILRYSTSSQTSLCSLFIIIKVLCTTQKIHLSLVCFLSIYISKISNMFNDYIRGFSNDCALGPELQINTIIKQNKCSYPFDFIKKCDSFLNKM